MGSISVRAGSPVLVGRDDELRVLTSVLAHPPAVAFVAGEAGVGKSRVLDALLHSPELAGRWTAVGRCQAPLSGPLQFGPLLDCLRGCADRLRELSPVTGVLAPYLPELAGVLPPPPAPLADPGAERHRLFRAVRALLTGLGPAVLAVEDLHWADDGTRALLRYLLSEPPPELGLVLTYRPEDLPGPAGPPGPLGGACRPAPQVGTVRVGLGPLDLPGVRRLADELTGGPVPLEVAEALHEHTAGIPFAVHEVLRAVGPELTGPGARKVLDAMPAPVPVREAMVERLAGLEPAARRIVHAAAVLGYPVGADVLGEVAAVPRDQRRDAVIGALAGNALVELQDGRYQFRLPLAQRAVYETLRGPDRAELHIRAVRALRKLQPTPALELAEHSRRAGRLSDWLQYGEAAADRAAESADAPAAIELLQRLLADPLPPSDVDRLALKLSRVAANGLHQHDVAALLQGLMDDQRLSDAVKGEIRLGLGLLLIRQADGRQTARLELERAVDELHEKPELALRAMAVLALPWVGTTSLSETRRWADAVDARIDECAQPWRTALLAGILGGRLHTGDPAVWPRIALLPSTVDTLEERRHLARAHLNVADACSWIGHYDRARDYVDSGLRLTGGCGIPFIVSTGRATELRLDWFAGDWSGLEARATTLLESYAELMQITSELCLVLAWLAAARGDWSRVESFVDQTGLATPENSISPIVIAASATAIGMELARGDADAAVVAADRGVRLLRRKGVWAWSGELAPVSVRAYCAAGRPSDGEQLLAELRSGVDGLDAPLARAAVDVCAAELAEHRGDVATARDLFAASQRRYAALGLPYQAQLHAERAALCRLELGDDDAAGLLTAVADRFELLGASRDAARCRHVLREHGAVCASRRGRRGYGKNLSPREHDVATLLAGSRSNQEIADALFLSKRTVEQHVANVLRKLGLSSRHDLAAHPEEVH